MKRALVTGVSRGIGQAVAEMLLDEGWAVDGVSRTAPDRLDGDRFWWIEADVSGPSGENLIRIDAEDGGRLDALIHCAGIRGPHGDFSDNAPAAWLETVQTNLLGTYHVVRACLPLLRQSEDGRILLFSGGGAFNPSPGYSAYAVAKAGVVSLMETLAVEERGRVAINCVAPGPVPTAIHDAPLPDDGGRAMALAVACVRHLLDPATQGLTGKTISAAWDDWPGILPWTVARLNDSDAGTRTRVPIAMLASMARAS